ncbi:hypothetical protein L6452_30668 [Arctium lappa]|uniref:Uncharacterized protein n=1 Tax=Arctium lappa TaxID=4217 RepID=A0ACB8ZJU4_ARCLA|nr:hypothetical protein L6452_30668 [Arctium lappa]
MDGVVGLDTACDVWNELEKSCSTLDPNPTTTTSHEVWTKYRPLYGAIRDGHWDKAQDIFSKDEKALTVKFNYNHDRALHVAISTCKHFHVVANLLMKIKHEKLLNDDLLTARNKLNPLHRAAMVGNTTAAQLLVKENIRWLFTTDNQHLLPIHRAIFGSHKETFLYLLRVTKENIKLSEEHPICERPFKGKKSGALLVNIIGIGLMDVAYDLIKEYPSIATMKDGRSNPLKSIAGKWDTYFSGAQYNFYQRFVYSCLSSLALHSYRPDEVLIYMFL